QHADVQLVRLGFEPTKPAEHPREEPVVPAPVALEHELSLRRAQAAERDVGANTVASAELLELRALPAGGGAPPRADGALRERPLGIGDHLGEVHAERPPEPTTGGARPDRRLVREEA